MVVMTEALVVKVAMMRFSRPGTDLFPTIYSRKESTNAVV